MNQNISLKSISDFETDKINFYIPSYQRGYRWKSRQVSQLIDDINGFVPTESTPFYFLQALAVARDTEHINVVDGQQRLTTLKLILGENSCGFTIGYAREANNALDEYFKWEASEVIKEKVGELGSDRRTEFCNKVKERCKFLYYEVDISKELSTFNELNSGKIPAKDSELVKCVMLTLGADEAPDLTKARADEWDEIERMLHNDSFFSFITPRNTWREEDRMTVLLRYAELEPSKEEREEEVFPFLTVILNQLKDKSRNTIWKSIYSAFYRLSEWYSDPLMYHAFGTVVHRRENSEQNMPIINKNAVVTIIESIAKYNPNKEGNDYHNWSKELFNYLLLSNVTFCWKRWPYRYSFEKHRQVDIWTMEHIFARNQKKLDEKELEEWLGKRSFSIEKFKSYQAECEKGKGDEWLSKELGSRYPSSEDNSIYNLALLPRDANSSLNNKLFEGKRQQICSWASERWKTYWIPPVTEAVFMKSLPGLKMTLPYWSQEDKEAYFSSMENTIKEFIETLKTPVIL